MFIVPGQTLPALTVEVGWSESYDNLREDMNRLLVGGNGNIKIVIIIKWTKEKNGHVSGILELYRNDRQGIPRLQQTEVIFPMPAGDPPQPLNIRRGELYGTAIQPGRNPNDILPLLVRNLRFHARINLDRMGLFHA